MKLRRVFKPNALKVITAVIISGFLTIFLFFTNAPLIPCLSKPLVNPELNVTYTPSLCPLGSQLIGVTVEFYWLSYLTIIINIVLAPYLLACLLIHYLQKTGKR